MVCISICVPPWGGETSSLDVNNYLVAAGSSSCWFLPDRRVEVKWEPLLCCHALTAGEIAPRCSRFPPRPASASPIGILAAVLLAQRRSGYSREAPPSSTSRRRSSSSMLLSYRSFCRALRSDRRQRRRGSEPTCRPTGPRDRPTAFLTRRPSMLPFPLHRFCRRRGLGEAARFPNACSRDTSGFCPLLGGVARVRIRCFPNWVCCFFGVQCV